MLINWIIFSITIALLIVSDFFFTRKSHGKISLQKTLYLSLMYVCIGLLYTIVIYYRLGSTHASEYLSAFLVEKTLSVDNLFVFSIIFSYLKIQEEHKHKILLLGVIGVILFRGIFIFLGASLIERFEWIMYLFSTFLIFIGVKMLTSKAESDTHLNKNLFSKLEKFLPTKLDIPYGSNFFIKNNNSFFSYSPTPLFTCLIFIEFSDVIFAIDSIPAVFSITTEPYIVFTSNLFAILGLRTLYFCLDHILNLFKYLKFSLGLILVFIGSKIFLPHLLHIKKIPAFYTLSITVSILAIGILASMYETKKET